MARNSPSEKPLAMRVITVAGREPSRNAASAVKSSPASRPFSRATGDDAPALGEWHPEQDAAPTGGGDAANAGNNVHARTVAIPTAMRNRVIHTSD